MFPEKNIEDVRSSLFVAGAGQIGNYDSCSFNAAGYGTFKAGDHTNPFVGEKGKLHIENEIKFETIYPKYLERKIISALLDSHPYEEVAYDIYPIDNVYNQSGSGMIGEITDPIDEKLFLESIKKI